MYQIFLFEQVVFEFCLIIFFISQGLKLLVYFFKNMQILFLIYRQNNAFL